MLQNQMQVILKDFLLIQILAEIVIFKNFDDKSIHLRSFTFSLTFLSLTC